MNVQQCVESLIVSNAMQYSNAIENATKVQSYWVGTAGGSNTMQHNSGKCNLTGLKVQFYYSNGLNMQLAAMQCNTVQYNSAMKLKVQSCWVVSTILLQHWVVSAIGSSKH